MLLLRHVLDARVREYVCVCLCRIEMVNLWRLNVWWKWDAFDFDFFFVVSNRRQSDTYMRSSMEPECDVLFALCVVEFSVFFNRFKPEPISVFIPCPNSAFCGFYKIPLRTRRHVRCGFRCAAPIRMRLFFSLLFLIVRHSAVVSQRAF